MSTGFAEDKSLQHMLVFVDTRAGEKSEPLIEEIFVFDCLCFDLANFYFLHIFFHLFQEPLIDCSQLSKPFKLILNLIFFSIQVFEMIDW